MGRCKTEMECKRAAEEVKVSCKTALGQSEYRKEPIEESHTVP